MFNISGQVDHGYVISWVHNIAGLTTTLLFTTMRSFLADPIGENKLGLLGYSQNVIVMLN